MTVTFTPQETAKVPAHLRPLMAVYPLAFDNLLEVLGHAEIRVPIDSLDIYFDDGVLPALSFSDQRVVAHQAPDDPQVLTVFANDECAYVQIQDRVLLNRIGNEFLSVFEIECHD